MILAKKLESPVRRWLAFVNESIQALLPFIQSGVLDSKGAISRLCHFAQRCDSDGLPPLGYASGEDHGIGRTRTRVPIRRHVMCWSST